MKRYISPLIIAVFTLLIMQSCFAEDLLIAYHQAVQSDPTFKKAEADWLAITQLAPISRAALLPNLAGTASEARLRDNHHELQLNDVFYQTAKHYDLNLQQAIFDYKAWMSLKNAKAQVKQGRATYNAAAQNLILRVATAYLAVLQAYDELVVTQAQERALAQQLEQTRAQYEVGLIAITGVEQTKASYDAILAQEIGNKNTISDKLEELRAITGSFYTHVESLKEEFPLISPKPININAWVKIATQQNYTLQAAYYGMVAAEENIKVQRAGHFPTVTGTLGYSYDDFSATVSGGAGGTPSGRTDTVASGRVNLQLPVYQGGLVVAETQQAAFQYASASALREQAYRTTLTQTRENYLGVISGISKLQADRQAIISSQASLDATKAAYAAGNNTIVDVLNQQSSLYATQTTYTTDLYNYLLSILNLKLAAGILSPQDLGQINIWLTRHIDLSAYDFNNLPPVYKQPKNPKLSKPSKSTSY